jgi:hypothetical protein
MLNEKYELESDKDVMSFKFISIGVKGNIPKLILFQETTIPDVYNLVFGDLDEKTGEIDDEVVSNNNDTMKILATVAASVFAFTYKYPNAIMAAEGSTKVRTRLYRIGISNHLQEILEDFIVYGYKDKVWRLFEKDTDYDAFLIKRKKIKK